MTILETIERQSATIVALRTEREQHLQRIGQLEDQVAALRADLDQAALNWRALTTGQMDISGCPGKPKEAK